MCKKCPNGIILNETPLEEDDNAQCWKCQNCKQESEVNEMVQKLWDEVENLPRDDLQGNLKTLQKYREILHCNHSLLTELRVRIIPIITRYESNQRMNIHLSDFCHYTVTHK